MYTIAYYSPTGNTKLLAEDLHKELNGSLIDISKSSGNEVIIKGMLIIMFSIHAFSAPKKVIDFANNTNVSNVDNVGIIAVGCTTSKINDGASYKLRKIFRKRSVETNLDEVIQMPLTLVMNVPLEKNVHIVDNARRQIKSIALNIVNQTTSLKKMKISAKMISSIGNVEKQAARLFGLELHASKKCTSCGICWNNCPAQNIVKSKKMKPKFKFHCTMCMKCIYECPEQAVKPLISRFIPIKGGYNIKTIIDE